MTIENTLTEIDDYLNELDRVLLARRYDMDQKPFNEIGIIAKRIRQTIDKVRK